MIAFTRRKLLVPAGTSHRVTADRRALLVATLAALQVRNLDAPELRLGHVLDIGDVGQANLTCALELLGC